MTIPITTPMPITGTKISTSQFGADVVTDLNAIATSLNNPWIDFSGSFGISTTGAAITKGASIYQARYKQIGKCVDYAFKVSIGAGFSPGSGDYLWPAPVQVSANSWPIIAGAAWVNDSGTALRVGSIVGVSVSSFAIFLYNITGGSLGSAGPGTAWAAGDSVLAQIRYEAT